MYPAGIRIHGNEQGSAAGSDDGGNIGGIDNMLSWQKLGIFSGCKADDRFSMRCRSFLNFV